MIAQPNDGLVVFEGMKGELEGCKIRKERILGKKLQKETFYEVINLPE